MGHGREHPDRCGSEKQISGGIRAFVSKVGRLGCGGSAPLGIPQCRFAFGEGASWGNGGRVPCFRRCDAARSAALDWLFKSGLSPASSVSLHAPNLIFRLAEALPVRSQRQQPLDSLRRHRRLDLQKRPSIRAAVSCSAVNLSASTLGFLGNQVGLFRHDRLPRQNPPKLSSDVRDAWHSIFNDVAIVDGIVVVVQDHAVIAA